MNITKSILLVSALFIMGFSACNNQTQTKESTTGEANKMEEKKSATTQALDLTASTITWHGTDPMKTHVGNISIASGEAKFDENGKLAGGTVTIDMNSITVTDDKTPEDKKPKLIGHLKSGDFFATDSFPISTFEIASIAATEGNNYTIKGNLTIRGKVNGIEIPATVTTTDGITHIVSTFTIDRTKWGVNFHAKGFDASIKDKFIDNLMEITIDVTTKK